MSKPKQCSQCDKPATIHLTQIIDGQVHKIDMCEDCMHSKGLTDPDGFSFPEIEKQEESEQDLIVCEQCGTTFADYKKTGRLGSAECYVVFKEELKPLLEKMHRNTRHVGKIPKNFGEKNISFLNDRLQKAVDIENYEEAARLRDKIKLIK